MCSGVAQLVEQVAVNHRVVGSSLTAGAILFKSQLSCFKGVAILSSEPTACLTTSAGLRLALP